MYSQQRKHSPGYFSLYANEWGSINNGVPRITTITYGGYLFPIFQSPKWWRRNKVSNNKHIVYNILAYNATNGDHSATDFSALQRLPVLDIYSYTPVTQVLPQKKKKNNLKNILYNVFACNPINGDQSSCKSNQCFCFQNQINCFWDTLIRKILFR